MSHYNIRSFALRFAAFVVLATSAAGALGAQEIEILRGGGERGPPAPGVRVTAHVSADLTTTDYTAALPLAGRETLAIQRRLQERGYSPGGLDGALGPRTFRAIDALRVDLGLEACGCIDGATLAALDLQPLVVQTFIAGATEGAEVEIIRPTRRPRREAAVRPEQAAVPAAPDAPPGVGEANAIFPIVPILRPTRPTAPRTAGGRVLTGRAAGLGRTSPPPRR